MHRFASIKEYAKRSRLVSSCYRFLVNALRESRRTSLQRQYPNGGFLECNGEKIFCDFHDPNFYWYDGDSESLDFEKRLVLTLLGQSCGDVYVDVGAHYGYFSSCMMTALRGKPVSILSAEPDEGVASCLRKTMGQYDGGDYPAATLLDCAIGAENKTIKAYRSSSLDCLHTYSDGDAHESSINVQVRTLDSVVDELFPDKRVAFIKVDVDGSEPDVLQGSKGIIALHKPIVYVEFAPWVLEGAGTDPKRFYMELHQAFSHVYWHSFQLNAIQRVGVHDYQRIHTVTADCVTNLVLCDRELVFDQR